MCSLCLYEVSFTYIWYVLTYRKLLELGPVTPLTIGEKPPIGDDRLWLEIPDLQFEVRDLWLEVTHLQLDVIDLWWEETDSDRRWEIPS